MLDTGSDEDAIYHIDCTYKINNNRFPVLIYGRSDNSGQFFPMIVGILGHETTNDYILFYSTMKKLMNLYYIKIFESPVGVASTNNPVESCNKQFKQFYTKHSQLTMIQCVKMMVERFIPDILEMTYKNPFNTYRRPSVDVRSASVLLKIDHFERISDEIILYYDRRSIQNINTVTKTCSCRWFLAYATCSHILRG